MSKSYVVTGGGRGVGRAIVERLLPTGGNVVIIELDPAAVEWTHDRPDVTPVVGNAAAVSMSPHATRPSSRWSLVPGFSSDVIRIRPRRIIAWSIDGPGTTSAT